MTASRAEIALARPRLHRRGARLTRARVGLRRLPRQRSRRCSRAVAWAFPLYWALVTTFKPENEVVSRASSCGRSISPSRTTSTSCLTTKIGLWYINSLITSGAVTVIVVLMAAGAGYAISQLRFPGRRLFWWMILASFMVPIPALIVNHFILMSQFV